MLNPELDLSLLSLMTYKDAYKKYGFLLDHNSLSDEGKEILSGYEKYFLEHKDLDKIDLSQFSVWFFNSFKVALTSAEQTTYKHIFSRLYSIPKEPIENVLSGLRYRKLGSKIIKVLGIEELLNGNLYSLKYFDTHKLENDLKRFNKSLNVEEDLCSHNISVVCAEENNSILLSSIGALNNTIKGYRAQYFHLVVAGTDGGKTALMVSEAVAAAAQIKEDEKILYFTNEQSKEEIRQRLYAAFLNKRNIKFDDFIRYIKSHEELAMKKYHEEHGDKIEIISMTGKSLDAIKKYCDKFNTRLILLDQIDHMINNKEGHRPYQSMYSRIRSELAQTYAPVIGVTQAKDGGIYYDESERKKKYKQNIDSGQVAWSSYDKQGNVDVLIGVGVMNDDPSVRHFIIDRHKRNLKGDFYARLLYDSSRYIDL